jgi:hypothetical protein
MNDLLIYKVVDLQSFWYSQCALNFNHSQLKYRAIDV